MFCSQFGINTSRVAAVPREN